MESDYAAVVSSLAGLGIRIVGSCGSDDWETDPLVSSAVPPERRPKALMPGCRSALVFGIPVQKCIADTSPSVWYREHYKVLNSYLDMAAERAVLEFERRGRSATAVPRDGYLGIKGLQKDPSAFFSHKYSAYLCGIGTFGMNGSILTEEYGPRIRLVTVLTDAALPQGRVMEKQICNKCGMCARSCPVRAISCSPYTERAFDAEACVKRQADLASEGVSPCGICISVCPEGSDSDRRGPAGTPLEIVRGYRL
ncbi:MAG: 4Fe-4S binding protein [Candidatus Methanomethylophilaceae archaeon]